MNSSVSRRRKFNSKRRLHKGLDKARENTIAQPIAYRGSSHHKRVPGDFGFTPPSSPRPGKTLCDGVGIFQVRVANRLLRKGAECGLVSNDADQGFPRYIWVVTENGDVLEARCDNPKQGMYHGYPLEHNDPMSDMVIRRWKEKYR